MEVPPHPGRIESDPRFRIPPYIYNSYHPETKTVFPPRRHRPARCGSPTTMGCLLVGWRSWSRRHPGRIESHSRTRNISMHIHLQQPKDKNATWYSIFTRSVIRGQNSTQDQSYSSFSRSVIHGQDSKLDPISKLREHFTSCNSRSKLDPISNLCSELH